MKLHRICKALIWSLAICLAVFSAGCLEGDKSIEARYDDRTDSFTYLIVYQNISSSQDIGLTAGSTQPTTDPASIDAFEHDTTYLTNLYNNRDYLIFVPPGIPGGNIFGPGENALIKLPENSVGNFSLGDVNDPINVITSPVPLDQIKITPGSLFLAPKGNLSYYHQVSFPGKLVDQLLPQIESTISTSWDEMIDAEQQRRQAGGAPQTWADATAKLLAQINFTPGPTQITNVSTQPTTEPDFSPAATQATSAPLPFSDESLAKLKAFFESHKPYLHRTGSVFSMQAPLSEADVTGVLSLIDASRKALHDRGEVTLDTIQFKAADKTTLEVTVDLIQWINAQHPIADAPPTDVRQLTAAKQMAAIAAYRLPLDKTITLQRLVAEFRENALTANPSAHPVAPGTGLGELKRENATTESTTAPAIP